MNKLLTKSMDIIRSKHKNSTIKKNTEDTETETLDNKGLQQKANKTLKDNVEYAELNTLVKKIK